MILTSAMHPLSITGAGIRRVTIGVQGTCVWILDDLCFDSVATQVEASTWGAVKAVFK